MEIPTTSGRKRSITERQAELLRIISEWVEVRGYPPTLKEMASRLGVKSDQAVRELLMRLEGHGAIIRTPGISRGIVLTDVGHRVVAS